MLVGLKLSSHENAVPDSKGKLYEMMRAFSPTAEMKAKLLTIITNFVYVVKDESVRERILQANIRFVKQISYLDGESFMHKQLEQLQNEGQGAERADLKTKVVLILLKQLLDGSDESEESQESGDPRIVVAFSQKLLNILLTKEAGLDLKKRETGGKELKKAEAALGQEQLKIVFDILCSHLRRKCNTYTVKGAAGLQQGTVNNLRLANRLC